MVLKGKLDRKELSLGEEVFGAWEAGCSTIAAQCNNGLFLLNAEAHVTYCNRIAEEVFGCSLQEIMGKKFLQVLSPRLQKSEIEEAQVQLHESFDSKDGASTTVAIIGRDGVSRNMQLRVFHNQFRDKHYIAILIDDKPNSVALEEKIKEQAEFIRSINENANMIVAKLKPDGTVVFLNSNAEEVTGYKQHEVVGENWFAIFSSSSDGKILKRISEKAFRRTATIPFLLEIKTKTNERRIISFTSSVLCNEQKEVAEIVFFGVDITSQKLLQEEIKRSEEKYKALFESSKDAIYAIDLDGNFFAANSGGYELTGYKAEEVIGKNHLPLFHQDDREKVHHFFKKSTQGEVTNFEARLLRKDGQLIVLDIKDSPIYQEGRIIGVYGAGRDITEKKKAEERISRMNRLASLGQLSAGIAHEIRNPLSGLNLNIDILARESNGDPERREVIKDIKAAIHHMEYTVRNILDFAQPKSVSLEEINLNDLVESSYNLVRMDLKHCNIEAEFSLQPKLPPIQGSPYQIEQALINIILNAKEAMPSGGVIRVATLLVDERKAVLLSITDTGVGIQEADLSRIFDPFYTTKYEGTGLGLSIACRTLEEYGATIEVMSKPEGGATFSIKFPISVDKG